MPKMSLVDAYKSMYKNEHEFGINFEELKNNQKHHNKLFYDCFGIPYKWMNNTLHYSDEGYHPKVKREWNECYMEGADLPFKTFFTPRQFSKIKPGYLR